MSALRVGFVIAIAGASFAWAPSIGAETIMVDDFESPAPWSAHPADGVELAIASDAGAQGRSIRLDFRFLHGGGYAVIRRTVALDLPANYRFRFRVRGQTPDQNLEFKLIDSTGSNVWWVNRRDFHFPTEWEPVSFRRRHIQFAWGPAGGGEIRHVAAIEFAVTAGSGGSGSVWLDELELEPLPVVAAYPPPIVSTSRTPPTSSPAQAMDRDPATFWASAPGDATPWIAVDFGVEREFGGVILDWQPGRAPRDYDLEVSADATTWRTVRQVRGGNGGRDVLHLPESESRYLQLRVLAGTPESGVALSELTIQPVDWAATEAGLYETIAKDAPRGRYPREFVGEQSYWTVIGVDKDTEEALLNEDGLLETGKTQFSIEPFVFADGKLMTWSDVSKDQWLEQGALPIPSVLWTGKGIQLVVTAFVTGEPGSSSLVVGYRVIHRGPSRSRVTLYLALRPFQVNPPTQFLNTPGGVAPIKSLERRGPAVRVNGDRWVLSLTPPSGFGAAIFDQGDISEFLAVDRLPTRSAVTDPVERASGAFAYRFDLQPEAEREVALRIPLGKTPVSTPSSPPKLEGDVEALLASTRQSWTERLDQAAISLPDSELVRTLRAQIAYVLVNRDGLGIQPGSRAYERSWIRDGSLTASAMLRMGYADVAREFVEWFASYQYEDGKVPCCVDWRGADPVPEHDSHGELIFLVAETYRHTSDPVVAQRWWPVVSKAAAYLDTLRKERRTAEYRAPGKAHFFGLLPPSISHEGYSAKPMHSYWDDFFALRGFKDAAYLAGVLGDSVAAKRWSTVRDQFARDLVASLAAAMRRHRIDYLPGCADLGDFDATSTTIALSPGGALGLLPRRAVERTFERYWTFFKERRDGTGPMWDAYTPYEIRTVGSFVRLGWRDRAQELLKYFMTHRRPPAWAQWAEVVGRDARKPRFIGDMPHTWVGSDFVRSVLDLLAYEDEASRSMVLAAGVPLAWARDPRGVSVRGLSTHYGPLDYTLRPQGNGLEIRIEPGLRVPAGGIVIRAPGKYRKVLINDAPQKLRADGSVVVRELPAVVTLQP